MPTRYGYYNQDGEFVKTSNVAVAIWPQKGVRRWLCSNGHTMNLYPLDKSQSAECWECSCKKVTMNERDQCWKEVTDIIKLEFSLDKLEYLKKEKYLSVVSGVWIGRDRLESKRKKINQAEHDEIEAELLRRIQQNLQISIYDLEQFFREE